MASQSSFTLAIICGLVSSSPVFAREHAAHSSAEIQLALRAEANGKLDDREEILKQAASSNEKLAHWLRGEVLVNGKWMTIEEVAASEQDSRKLAQYLKARDDSRPTVASQESLAQMCQQLRLKEQEQAHWQAVLQLAPDHATARQRLGFSKVNGKWVSDAKLKEQADLQQRVAEKLALERGSLMGLHQGLMNHRVTVEQAAAQLVSNDDISRFPAWERYLSASGETDALAVVAALDQLAAPEASLSLLRHALYHPSAEVKTAATKSLRSRDEHSYLPQLMSALRGPWMGEARFVFDPVSRQHVVRYAAVSENQESKDLQVIDDIYQLSGDVFRARSLVNLRSQATTSDLEQQRLAANAAIEAQNKVTMELLQSLTGVKENVTPQDWWKWWEEHSESISAGEKSTETAYVYRTSEVYGEPPPPVVSNGRSATPRREKHECLAAGTQILTNRGPIGVEQVRVGDLVLARHPATGETALKPVIQTTQRPPERLLQIGFGDHIVRASGGHPFWVSGKGWLRARELEAGMIVHGVSEPTTISFVVVEETPAPSFNLIVDGFHSYFVQAGNVRVFSHDNSLRDPIRTTVPGLHKPLRTE